MKPRHARIWHGARTLEDLGELTALWLEGDLASQPGYMPNHGPEPETLELIPTLAAVNRVGFVTVSSQPALLDPHDARGEWLPLWWQRAAVEGFADGPLSDYLVSLGREADLIAQREPVCRFGWWPRRYPNRGFPVTFVDDEIRTRFGAQWSRRDVRAHFGEVCSPRAVAAVCAAWQVTLIDPEPTRNDRLWPILDKVAEL